MTAAVLLALGAHDLTAALLPHRWPAGRKRTVGVLVGLTLSWLTAGAVLAATGALGATAGAALVALGLLLLWVYGGAERPLVTIGVIAAVGLLAVGETTGFLGSADLWPPAVVVLAAGLALVETSNRITRDVLVLAGRPDESDAAAATSGRGPQSQATATAPVPGPAHPELAQAEVERAHGAAAPTDSVSGARLRGGRYIGPMERVLMAALGLAGAFHVIGAVMAAKGIVRFPEISRGGDDGHRAEEFLVGSLTSWMLAAAAAFLAHAVMRPG